MVLLYENCTLLHKNYSGGNLKIVVKLVPYTSSVPWNIKLARLRFSVYSGILTALKNVTAFVCVCVIAAYICIILNHCQF